MPIKPDQSVIAAYDTARKDPQFAKHAMEAIINETPELRDALIEKGLVEEVRKED